MLAWQFAYLLSSFFIVLYCTCLFALQPSSNLARASSTVDSLQRKSLALQPASLAPASFTVDSLQRLEAGDADTVRWGPPTQMTAVTAATRHHLATAIMVAFNARLSTLPKIALMHLCKAVSK